MSAPSPLELARVATRQQRALLELARERLDESARARAGAEAALAKAEAEEATARAAVAANRTDDKLADVAGRSAVRTSLSRADLTDAIARHAEALEAVAKAERAVDEAERSAKRAELEAKILAPERSAAMQARGEAVVSLIVRLRKEVEGIVAALAEDADEVAKARTLGSTVDYADGLQVAAGLARALLDHGGSLRHDDHQLRWLCEFAIGPGKPAIDAAKAAAALVPFVFASLGATAPAYERAELERRASVYARYRNAAGAFREEEERMRIERERSRRAGVAAAEQAMARRPAATRLRPVPAKPRPESSQGRFSPVAEELPDGPFTPSESDGPRVAAE